MGEFQWLVDSSIWWASSWSSASCFIACNFSSVKGHCLNNIGFSLPILKVGTLVPLTACWLLCVHVLSEWQCSSVLIISSIISNLFTTNFYKAWISWPVCNSDDLIDSQNFCFSFCTCDSMVWNLSTKDNFSSLDNI